MSHEKDVDESWKDVASKDKETLDAGQSGDSGLYVEKNIKDEHGADEGGCGDPGCDHDHSEEAQAPMEVNFMNYITSMGDQTMIFLGEIPHPMSNQIEKNLDQAKFLIDTLAMIKEKTQGNLNEQEENLMSASVYELQMKFAEISQKGEA